jgi:glucose/arabinose dehydrogenase
MQLSRRALLPAIALVVAACGSVGSSTPTFPAVESQPAASASSSPAPSGSGAGPSATVPVPGDAGDRPDLPAVRVTLEPVVEGLDRPIFVTGAGDGSGRLFVAEQGGRIRVAREGELLPEPFVDLSDRVQAGGERGLLGLAFPPGFGPERPVFQVHYSDEEGDTVIAELQATTEPDRADPGSERLILAVTQPYANHNGGWIGFDPDGMLLVALGDGGSGGDPENRASDPEELLGKMLRLDVLGAPDGTAYSIPSDNPFVGRTGARPEILHYGLRNPFRASIDVETGDLWIGDVGQNAWEEIDVARSGSRGLDFGWRRWEARDCFDQGAGCEEDGVTMPVAVYPHPEGCSVIGGMVYRGDAIPALRGAYLFSDYCSGTLWAIDATLDEEQAPFVLAETGRSISSIGIDGTGEIVLTDLGGGELLRLVSAG